MREKLVFFNPETACLHSVRKGLISSFFYHDLLKDLISTGTEPEWRAATKRARSTVRVVSPEDGRLIITGERPPDSLEIRDCSIGELQSTTDHCAVRGVSG